MFKNQLSKKKTFKPKTNNLNSTLFIYISVIVIVFIFGMYFWNFAYLGISNDSEVWAQFGDFIGGILNPFLAFLAFIALLFTIKLQSDALNISKEELEATRKELEKSRIAQEEQSESLKLQNEATKIQIFENTFFQLFEQHNKMLNNCYDEYGNLSILDYSSSRCNEFNERYQDANKNELIDNFKNTNYKRTYVKNYFMTLYQLLKFIDLQCNNKFDAKFYTNMIRALLEDEILKALAVNCIAYERFSKYKEYIEKYELFEHLFVDENDSNAIPLFDIFDQNKHQ